MSSLKLTLDRYSFHLIWQALHSEEKRLLKQVEIFGEDSEQGADALNDLIALRLYRKELKQQAAVVFDNRVFIVN